MSWWVRIILVWVRCCALLCEVLVGIVRFMKRCGLLDFWIFSVSCALLLVVAVGRAVGEPSPAAVSGFNSYVGGVEARLARQHGVREGFLAGGAASGESGMRLRRGELIVEQLTPAGRGLPGAMLHHWRGTAFAAGATAADFERLMRDFDAYPQRFSPQVVQAKG